MGTPTLGQDIAGPKLHARYPDGLVNQGISAELIAAKWGFSRAQLDDFSAQSHARASAAERDGLFANEIVPIPVLDAAGGTRVHTVDETVRATTTADGLAGLNPSFYSETYAQRFPQVTWAITPGSPTSSATAPPTPCMGVRAIRISWPSPAPARREAARRT